MKKAIALLATLGFAASLTVAQDVVSFFHGTIKKIDKATKTVVIKTADGTEKTIKVTGDAVVDGTKDGFNGLKEGTVVVARATAKGTEATADEIGKVGKDGLKSTEGVITKFDQGAKTVVVKTADGTEKTFQLTDHAVVDASKATAAGVEKSAKVTVYYTEEAGKKTAHYLAQ